MGEEKRGEGAGEMTSSATCWSMISTVITPGNRMESDDISGHHDVLVQFSGMWPPPSPPPVTPTDSL